MNDQLTNIRLVPKSAVIVYAKGNNYHKDYYLESREIKNIGGKLQLQAPIPLASHVMKDIAKTFMKKNSFEMDFGGLIPSHILYAENRPGQTIVMWYRPEMKKSLNFSASLNIKGSSEVVIPATLYLVVNSKLYLYALENNERPELSTKLFNAPFFNIYEDGNVCLGTAPIGKIHGKTFEKEAERFERGFYMAEQGGGMFRDQCKTPIKELWTALLKKKVPFPSKKELIQHKKFKTLQVLIGKMIGHNSNDNYDDDDQN